MLEPKGSLQAFHRTEDASKWILSQFGKSLRIASVLGLGKPNALLNCLYDSIANDPSRNLTLYTALSLDPPRGKTDLENAFLLPFAERQWGSTYPRLHYLKDIEADESQFPANIQVHEFYFQAGTQLQHPLFQRNYQSLNYTQVAQCLVQAEIQVVVQLVARRINRDGTRYSLSCNPDLSLDVKDRFRARDKTVLFVGVVHPELPFLGGEAEVSEDFFAAILDDPAQKQELFALPRTPIDETDHAIGFFASQLIPDDGTLQIGIGSLSDAVVHCLINRHEQTAKYRELVDFSWQGTEFTAPFRLELGPFLKGLYGLSEMITDGFMHLRRHGILKREVHDEQSGRKTYLHAAFYLGSKVFYDWLRTLGADDYAGLRMGRISSINDLYDPNEILLRRQRKNARFLNTCMQVTLLGGAASETLENGGVVSGVGGQYNFVSMALELEGAHSILMLRSTREAGGKRSSNVVWSHGHLTIPRHLRDIVVTEYGIAYLRNKSDQDTIAALLNIADSAFQPELLAHAKKCGKISKNYEIPIWARHNTPERVTALLKKGQSLGFFAAYPFGSDFTAEEERLALALPLLASKSPLQLLKSLLSSFQVKEAKYALELERLNLSPARTFKTWIYRRLVLASLKERFENA